MKILIPVLMVALLGCKTNQTLKMTESGKPVEGNSSFRATPSALVYKTRADYSNLVPVLLSDDKSQIVSYPDPADLRAGSGYPSPTRLHDGYLLDNRGINVNVAFLDVTYREYSKLKQVPTLQELFDLIKDKDPLIELYDCGKRNAFSDPKSQLNKLIDKGELHKSSKVLK